MYDTERREQILAILNTEQRASVSDLAARLYASPSTIRRDLAHLAAEQRICRTFGGATALSNPIVDPLAQRERSCADEKREICRRAAALIHEGDVIFLDASSTAFYLVEELRAFSAITVLTNSLRIAAALTEMPCKSICTGGELMQQSLSCVGVMAAEAVCGMRADLFFFSARGLSPEGEINDSCLAECQMKRAMLSRSARSVFLCCRNKIGLRFPHVVCRSDTVDEIIFGSGT